MATVSEDENKTHSLDIEPRDLIHQNSCKQQGLNRKHQVMEDIATKQSNDKPPEHHNLVLLKHKNNMAHGTKHADVALLKIHLELMERRMVSKGWICSDETVV